LEIMRTKDPGSAARFQQFFESCFFFDCPLVVNHRGGNHYNIRNK
jgi:hypothetical protein